MHFLERARACSLPATSATSCYKSIVTCQTEFMGQSPFNRHVWFEKGKETKWEWEKWLWHSEMEEMFLIPVSNLCIVFTSNKDEIWIGKIDFVAFFSAFDRNWILFGFWGAKKPKTLLFSQLFFFSDVDFSQFLAPVGWKSTFSD